MSDKLARMLAAFQPQENEGPSKLCTMQEAVSKHVKPGDHIFLSQRGSAGVYEVIRQFWNTKPGFTLSSIMVSDLQFLLAYTGLATKVITSSLPYGRSPKFQQVLRDKLIEAEIWTIHTIILRYMAGGTGVPFLPTRSIIGSSVGPELSPKVYTEADDPFGDHGKIGLVAALRPDVAIIHGLVADAAGNTVLPPDGTADCWGARSRSRSTIVSVERIVSTETIRRYSPLVTIPAYMVDAVCEIPMGAHPREMYNGWVTEAEPYVNDSTFSKTYLQALQEEDGLSAWVKEWVLDVPSFDAFLEKLGDDRLKKIKATAGIQLQEQTLSITSEQRTEYSDLEMMAVAAGRKIEEVVRHGDYRFMQVGPGIALPATFLAYSSLRAQDYDIEVMVGWGFYGYRPHNASLSGLPHLSTPKMFGSMFDMYASLLRGPDSPSLGILGIAEIDKYANINVTRLANGTYLSGGGGHNDCAMGAGEVLVTGRISPNRFRSELGFITTPGDRVRTVVTDLGVLEKRAGSGELELRSYYGKEGVAEEQAIAAIKEQCGWELKVAPDVYRQPPPSREELAIIRLFVQRRGETEE